MARPAPVDRPGRPAQRRLLLSAAGPAMAPLLALTSRTFRAYAARHGYDVQLTRLHDTTDRTSAAVRAAKWAKIRLLRAALDEADLALWLDADAVVMRFDRDIADDLDPGDFQALTIERFPDRHNPNTGVWLLRSDTRSRQFLDEVLAVGQLPHSWADQATVCHLLGWSLGDHHGVGARPIRLSPHRDGTTWLDPSWNVVGPPRPDTRIRHVAGQPLARRHRLVADLLGGLAATGAVP